MNSSRNILSEEQEMRAMTVEKMMRIFTITHRICDWRNVFILESMKSQANPFQWEYFQESPAEHFGDYRNAHWFRTLLRLICQHDSYKHLLDN